MRHDPLYLAWDLLCPSPEAASRVQELLLRECCPDAVLTDVVTSAGTTVEVAHRVGDYFDEVLVLPAPGSMASRFRVVFYRSPEAGRFWKDLMARILRRASEARTDVSLTLAYKGDTCLDWTHLTPVGNG